MTKRLLFFSRFARDKRLALILISINLAGATFGIHYYWEQFLRTPPFLLPFVPDSPAAVLLFAVFLFLYAFRKYQHPAFNLLTSVALIKVGFWSVFVLVLFWPSYFSLNPQFSLMLILLHVGMIIEAFVILSVWKGRAKRTHGAVVLAWFLLGDFMDYVVGTVPYPIPFIASSFFTAVAYESVTATFVLFFLLRRRG